MTTPGVDAAERLYRQIVPGGNPIWFQEGRRPLVHRVAFHPSPSDIDGLSLIRSAYRSRIWSGHRPEKPAIAYRLAITVCGHLTQFAESNGFVEFDLVSNEDALDAHSAVPWAHRVVREVNITAYKNDEAMKRKIQEWALAVADSIANEDVIGPFPSPTEADSYRPKTANSIRRMLESNRQPK